MCTNNVRIYASICKRAPAGKNLQGRFWFLLLRNLRQAGKAVKDRQHPRKQGSGKHHPPINRGKHRRCAYGGDGGLTHRFKWTDSRRLKPLLCKYFFIINLPFRYLLLLWCRIRQRIYVLFGIPLPIPNLSAIIQNSICLAVGYINALLDRPAARILQSHHTWKTPDYQEWTARGRPLPAGQGLLLCSS